MVADELHYPLVGPADYYAEAAREYNVTPEQLNLVDERQPGWWERLTADSARLGAYFRAAIMNAIIERVAPAAGSTTYGT